MLKVFVSSTTRDLERHRDAIKQVILDLPDWYPVLVNEHGGASTNPTVAECRRRLAECHLMVLVVAFRRGWVPAREEGGDGENSITALELAAARTSHIPALIFFADTTWPVGLSDQETEADRAWIRRFRDSINQPVCFFSSEGRYTPLGEPIPGPEFIGKVRQELVKYWEQELKPPSAPASVPAGRAGLQPLLPSLLPILSNLLCTPHTILQEYDRCAPPDWEPLPANLGPRELLACCAISLSSAPRQHNGRVPLLGFLRAIAAGLQGDSARQLDDWVEQAAAHLGISPGEPQQLKAAVAVPPSANVSRIALMIQIEKAKTSDGNYLLKAWLSGTDDLPTLREGSKPLSLDELRQEVRQVCTEVEQVRPVGAELLIEFLLSGELTTLDPEWWEVEDELSCAVPLATRHPTVVRPLIRHRVRPGDEIKQAWLRRWTALEGHRDSLCHVGCTLPPDPPTCPAVRHDRPEGGPFRSLLALAPSVVCVILGRPLSGAASDKDLLGPVLSAGIPATLWLRGNPDMLPALIDEVRRTKVGELPQLVLRLRCEAHGHGDRNHVGWHLALLWDDVRRLSPELDRDRSNPLTQPARLTAP